MTYEECNRTNERFVIGMDFNTKDWFVWDDVKETKVFFDSEGEAVRWVIEKVENQ